MVKSKVDILVLNQMLKSGKTVKHCAKFFDVSPSAISQHKKKLNIAVVKNLVLENAARTVDKSLNAIGQLEKINKRANELLDRAENDPDIALRCMAEVRNQLRLQLEILKTLFDLKAVEAFQREVLTAIAEVDPYVRDRIINNLKERQAVRSTLRFN